MPVGNHLAGSGPAGGARYHDPDEYKGKKYKCKKCKETFGQKRPNGHCPYCNAEEKNIVPNPLY